MDVILVEPLHVLNAIQLRRLLDRDDIIAFVGGSQDAAEAVLRQAEEDGLIIRREGRRSGWMLTEAGTARLQELRDAELAQEGARPAVESLYAAFLPVNDDLKQLFTDWQMRPGPEPVPNDHTDTEYDQRIIERLHALHEGIRPELARTSEVVPRFATYPRRCGVALERIDAGEHEAVARPLASSYHDVWMELHQDLLGTLGRERGVADGH